MLPGPHTVEFHVRGTGPSGTRLYFGIQVEDGGASASCYSNGCSVEKELSTEAGKRYVAVLYENGQEVTGGSSGAQAEIPSEPLVQTIHMEVEFVEGEAPSEVVKSRKKPKRATADN